MLVAGDFAADVGKNAELFLELAGEGLAGRLAGLDFTAGELPLEAMAVLGLALPDQEFAIAAKDACDNDSSASHYVRIDEDNSLYSERLLKHFREAKRAGELPEPAISVTVENQACGDVLKLTVRVEAGRIEDTRFLVRGCTASIACGSALAEWLIYADVKELKSRRPEEIAASVEAEVGGLPDASKHAARLMAEGVTALLKRLDV
jgi:nitrogen fixation NifU-like protein